MRIVMMGTGTFAEPTFEALIAAGEVVVGLVTQPERDTGRKGSSTRQTGRGMASIAASANIPVVQPESINTPDGLAQLKAFDPELLVVAAYGQILSKDVISTPTHGAINVNASLLPKYRGASPIAPSARRMSNTKRASSRTGLRRPASNFPAAPSCIRLRVLVPIFLSPTRCIR